MENQKQPLNIYQRLDKVRQAVAYIQKDAKVEGYKAITHDVVTSEIRPHLISNGIIVIPRQISFEIRDTTKTTKSGTPFTICIGHYEIDYVNIDNPDEKITVPIWSVAEDHGDKGPGKALSYATKYAHLKVFNIETGESDESRADQKPAPIADENIVTLREICESGGLPIDETLQAMAKKVFRVSKVQEIPLIEFERACEMLNKKIAKEAKHSLGD